MSYLTERSGFTAPPGKGGRGTPYHIDLKLSTSLPIAERVRMLDAVARQKQAIGREIEFSNPAVSGRRWNANAPLEEKVDLLERAAAAHGHSQHTGWQSFDYYVPFKGKSRFDKGAVEDASIYIPAVAGGKVKRGSGGGYGYFSESLDPGGRVIARVGHGNIDRPEAGDVNVLGKPPSALPLPGPTTQQDPNDSRVLNLFESLFGGQEKKQESLTETLMGGLLQQALSRRGNFSPSIDALAGQPNPYSQYVLSPKMLEQFG
jgi:hypothetical protein